MGKASSSTGKALLKEQAVQSKQIFGETTPARQEFTRQMQELLQTGGVGSRLPIVQNAVEGARGASSAAMAGTERQLAQSGLSNTPFGQAILANQQQQGAVNVENTRFGVSSQLFNQIAPWLQGQSGQAASQGLGSAQALSQQGQAAAAAKNQQTQGYVSAGVTAAATIASIAALYSDERLKEMIEHADPALRKLLRIKVRSFKWKKTKKHQPYGVIAQELAAIIPELVNERSRPMTVDVLQLVALLIKAVQEQQVMIDKLRTRKKAA